MLDLKTFIAASAAAALFASAKASELVVRNGEPAKPACTTPFQPFVYAGCFSDPSSPQGLLYTSGLPTQNMTVEICVAFCKGNDYKYAGLEYYGECFCGASVNGVQLPESDCSFPCTGNSSEICGGNDILSIYQDPTFPTVNDAIISDYQLLGCYSEGTSGRSLAWRQDQLSTTNLTVEECLFACKDGGYDFAGVEFAQECYCGVVLGNGTTPLASSSCNMACTGNAAETCGGSSTLDIYLATDLESNQPCGYSSSSSSSTVSSTTTSSSSSTSSTSTTTTTSSSSTKTTSTSTSSSTSSTSTSTSTSSSSSSTSKSSTSTTCTTLTTSKSSTTSSTPKPTTTTPTTSTKTTASLCTSTTTISPTPTCEWSCGNWCSSPLPTWGNQGDCLKAVAACSVQVNSCFLQAGFPASLNCFEYSTWCTSISQYCRAGGSCSLGGFKSKYPPSGPPPPAPTVSTSVYTCPAKTTSVTKPTTTSVAPSSTSCVPVPTVSNICSQPNNPWNGYTSSNPVGGITLPVLTCNNVQSEYNSGNCLKLYIDPDTYQCPSYPRSGSSGPGKGCKDACDSQYNSCIDVYAQGCKNKKGKRNSGDNYWSATTKCKNQWNDCYSTNQGVTGSGRCGTFNGGWSKN